jgi:penicillin amidase
VFNPLRHALAHPLSPRAVHRSKPPPPPLRKPRRRWRLVRRTAGVLLAILVMGGVFLFLYLRDQVRGSLPKLDGTVHVRGLDRPVRIERDALGVPTLHARSRADLAFATGFVHAQDRFFQMDLLRRNAAGELAELLGPAGLGLDRQARLHGLRNVARRVVRDAKPAERRLIRAYVEGVEAGRRSLRRPPWEYLVLRTKPAPWTEEDTVLVALGMFLILQQRGFAWEATCALVHETLPPALADFLTPAGSSWDAPLAGADPDLPPIPPPECLDLRRRRRPPMPVLPPPGPDSVSLLAHPGSNCWAVAGRLTEHGGAIVANDMHLPLGIPNLWYRASFHWEDPDGQPHEAHGVTLPGTPALVVGSNTHIAWGFTNTEADWADLVVLETDPARPGTYRTPTGAQPFVKRTEVLRVRGDEPKTLEVLSTIWGPVFPGHDAQGRLRALRWVAHDPAAVNFGLVGLETARKAEEALQIAQEAGVPGMNFIVGDAEGNIGWTICGRIPRRVGFDGRLPVSFADGRCRWDGWLTPAEYPTIYNPRSGRLWTANNRVVGGDDLKKLGQGAYDLGARARQIRDDLRARERFTEEDMLAIQLDDRALFLERWRGLLLRTLSEKALDGRPDRQALRRAVRFWGGHASTDSVGYRIVRAFRDRVHHQILRALTVPCRRRDRHFDPSQLAANVEGSVWRLVQEQPMHLLPRRYAGWDDLFLAQIDKLLAGIAKQGGGDVERGLRAYTWGACNTVHLRHLFSDSAPLVPWLLDLDMPPQPMPGDVNMPRVQTPGFGASERLAVSPGREAQGYFHMPGGQSGHPLSPHYRDGHAAWVEGRPTPFLPGPAVHVLELLPEG